MSFSSCCLRFFSCCCSSKEAKVKDADPCRTIPVSGDTLASEESRVRNIGTNTLQGYSNISRGGRGRESEFKDRGGFEMDVVASGVLHSSFGRPRCIRHVQGPSSIPLDSERSAFGKPEEQNNFYPNIPISQSTTLSSENDPLPYPRISASMPRFDQRDPYTNSQRQRRGGVGLRNVTPTTHPHLYLLEPSTPSSQLHENWFHKEVTETVFCLSDDE